MQKGLERTLRITKTGIEVNKEHKDIDIGTLVSESQLAYRDILQSMQGASYRQPLPTCIH